jgi:hypothetical protein
LQTGEGKAASLAFMIIQRKSCTCILSSLTESFLRSEAGQIQKWRFQKMLALNLFIKFAKNSVWNRSQLTNIRPWLAKLSMHCGYLFKRSGLSKIPDFRVGVDVKRILIGRGIGYSFDETTPPVYSLFINFYQDEYVQS